MNLPSRITAIAWVIISYVSTVYSQTLPHSQAQNPAPRPEEGVLLKSVGQAKAHYRPRDDQTGIVVITKIAEKFELPKYSEVLTLMVYFTLPGKKVAQPKNVYMIFSSISPQLKYQDNHKLTIYCEGLEYFSPGTRVELLQKNELGFFEGVRSSGIAYKDFLRLLESREVVIQLGSTKVELKEENLEALRDLKRIIEK